MNLKGPKHDYYLPLEDFDKPYKFYTNKIEIDVDFLAYIWFPKDTEIIEIKQADPFQEGGKIDQIEDIKPLPK